MKFQSFIAGIMHGLRPAARVAPLVVCALSLASCVSLNAKKNTYSKSVSSPPVRVNGAEIRMQVKPEGTANGSIAISAMVYSAAIATLEGPFRWRIEATGGSGHRYVVVHRIRTRTGKSKRDEWYPASYLGKRADFKAVEGQPAVARAVYPIPGLLRVKSDDDGSLEVSVDLTVADSSRTVRKTVTFRLDPSKKRQDEFIFIPTEIARSIGKPLSETEENDWD